MTSRDAEPWIEEPAGEEPGGPRPTAGPQPTIGQPAAGPRPALPDEPDLTPPLRPRPPARWRLAAAVLLTAGVALAPGALPAGSASAISAGSAVSGGQGRPVAGTGAAGGSTATGPGTHRPSDHAPVATDPGAEITRGRPAALSAPGAVTPAEQREVERYWTVQRRTRAFGAHTGGNAGAVSVAPAAAPLGGDPGTPTAPPPPSSGTPYTAGGLVAATTGRLFTTIGGSDYACSASVVSSPSRDLVVTAGHCVHGGRGQQFATHVAFFPGFTDGATPTDIWTARRLTVTAGWAQSSNFDVDAGFALFNTHGGKHLQDAVGAQGIAFNLPATYPQYAFGYPRLAPYDGSRLIYCAGPGTPDPYGGPSIGVACAMTAGASGGPLFTALGRLGPGHGWIDGVVSYAYAGSDHSLYGTRFNDVVKLLYYQSYRV